MSKIYDDDQNISHVLMTANHCFAKLVHVNEALDEKMSQLGVVRCGGRFRCSKIKPRQPSGANWKKTERWEE
jgi:hypothetical protein